MLAIVSIAGQQFKVKSGQQIYVHRLDAAKGDKLSFNEVLALLSDDNCTLGTPVVTSASVEATVMNHVQGDKVIVYKKKRRKGYEKKNGHRQAFTQIQINSIIA
ncbi:MAG: 50S ribosomal protein L21 [Saprospiraceae bacterium]|jgi:large subunit ribosomal protein L21|nr:50S ribosomal protein L21 [Saprospiraceae bacterium]MBK7795854.1 50S ribosomal protein L21 [Saprospiraceae bacterium]MBK8154408.1 50S ribosomal protein L21 [Saprospiraceae bacterium]MBL0260965.1 50S ribosomal protein L21 [Saprospiraceae bacterium]HMS28705.1 50S ribosomal protein L21 [Saprospiraceae bacterium]